jgi:hypothetical protein
VGGCYCNDLFREAAKMNIDAKSASIHVEADWGGDPVRAMNLSFSVRVESTAPQKQVEELIRHTDRAAEIPNSLRLGGRSEATLCRNFIFTPGLAHPGKGRFFRRR